MDRREFMMQRDQQVLVDNVTQLTRSSLNRSLNGNKDINFSCGYPNFISTSNYSEMYKREGVAKRVVDLEPDESWRVDPDVIEDETPKETTFEAAWKALQKEFKIYQYLQRIDKLSGVGRFGVLLIGIGDGLKLNEPSLNIDETTGETKETPTEYPLLYLRPFKEQFVMVKKTEMDIMSPRFGLPTMYSLQMDSVGQLDNASVSSLTSRTLDVHWSRILHVADNREESEVLGVPRMEDKFNRLLDIRKVLSGSGTTQRESVP